MSDFIVSTETELIEAETTVYEVVEVGIQGPPGPPGATGTTGDAGPQGERGPGITLRGALASTAELPAAGDAGDAYLVDGRIYLRTSAGVWVDGGAVGIPGSPGKDGQIRFTGYGPPPVVIAGAEPADVYLDIATGDIYKLT